MNTRFRFLSLICTFVLATQAHASVLTSVISGDDLDVDVLNDESVSFVADLDGNLAISAGDIIAGFLRIESTTASGPLSPTTQLIGLFSFEVTSSSSLGGGAVEVFNQAVDPSDVTGLSLDELIGGTLGPIAPNAAVAVISDPSNPVDPTDLTFAGAIAAFNSGTFELDAVIGFEEPDDFFQIVSLPGIDGNANGEIGIAELPAPSATGTVFANLAGGLTVLPGTDFASSIFTPVGITDLLAPLGPETLHDVTLSGSLGSAAADTPAGFVITDSTQVAINAFTIPEPASVCVWLVLGFTTTLASSATARKRS